jgi:O-acetylhomoserine (thiol)-lyase
VSDPDRELGFATRAIHAGQRPDPTTGARAMPIYQTTSYVFEDVDLAAAYFNLQEYGNTYARIMNPTVAAFEERVASLEGGVGSVAFASGLAAQLGVFFTILTPGDHVVSSRALYGGSITQLNHLARKLSISVTFVDPDDLDAWREALRPETKLLFGETIGNPSGNILDLAAVAEIAHGHGCPLVVDSTFASPYLCRPIEHGADIVIHSATKFLGGHGTTLGGVVIEAGRFDWGNGRFPTMTEPVPSYGGLTWWGNFQEFGWLTKVRAEQLRDIGPSLSPLAAFLLLQGVETLPQRMAVHVANARAVAEWLAADSRVSFVRWAGLPDHPHHELAARYTPEGPGAVFAFGVRGGRAAGERFIGAVQLASHLANVGDARTLVIHPGSTTHRQLSEEQLAEAGVPADLVRISVGLEDVDDILWDLDQALAAATKDET